MKNYHIILVIILFFTGCTDTFLDDGVFVEDQATNKSGCVLYVPENYATIQDAVNAASDKDIIKVSSGIYEENISIQNFNELTIVGDNSVLNQVAFESVFNFYNCQNFAISGFEINGPNKTFPAIGIMVHNSSGEIFNCDINGFWHGIYATNSPEKFSELLITDCLLQEFEKYGVVTWKGVDSEIKKNSFLKSEIIPNIGKTACVSVWGGTPIIKLNNFNSQGNGITITDDAYEIDGESISVNTTDSEIKGNDFYNCFIGISISTIYGGEVLNTHIANNNFINVNKQYLISVDESEVNFSPK